MKMKRTLLDDVEKTYFSISCTSGVSCEHCKNKVICDLTQNLLKSLKKFYISTTNMNHYSSKGHSYIEISNNER